MNYNINIEKFLEKFNKEYEFLYENYDNVAGFDEALEEGEKFLESNTEFITEFVKYRGDFLSSNREIVAFMFALESFE